MTISQSNICVRNAAHTSHTRQILRVRVCELSNRTLFRTSTDSLTVRMCGVCVPYKGMAWRTQMRAAPLRMGGMA